MRRAYALRILSLRLFMKPRLETPSLATGRKASPPEAGNQ
jgi:hypothetical protein